MFLCASDGAHLHQHCSIKPPCLLLIWTCGCGSQKRCYVLHVHAEMVFKIINDDYGTWMHEIIS